MLRAYRDPMRKTTLLALPLALLSACASADTPSTPSLAPSTWRFTTIDGAAPVAKQASLEFRADRLGANVGCNGMGGGWKLEGNHIVTDGIVSTMMYCAGVMDQERAVTDMLGAKPTYRIEGDRLTLSGGGHSATLVRQ